MKLALLGKNLPYRATDYRGLDRDTPNYINELPENHPINEMFWEFADRKGAYSLLDDLEYARLVVSQYSRLNPPIKFDIVELTDIDEQPQTSDHEFMGFDIACAYRISTLAEKLETDWILDKPIRTEQDQLIIPFYRVIGHYFAPLLNQNGLFTNLEDAKFCFEAQMAIQKIRPGFYEECEFKIIGLWKVI